MELRRGNLLAPVRGDRDEELCEALAGNGETRIERIVSRGQASAPGFWYDQDQDEFVLLIRGKARLGFTEGEPLHLGPGDWVLLPAHCRHRVAWTDPDQDTIWLAVFC